MATMVWPDRSEVKVDFLPKSISWAYGLLLAADPDRVHRRQVLGGCEPGRAGVARAEDRARGRAEVELERVAVAARRAAGERLAQDRQVGVVLGEAVAARCPRRAGVAGLVDAHAAVGGDAVDVGGQRDHVGAVGVGGIEREG